MTQVTSRSDLAEWLRESPPHWGHAIAVRLALRDCPNFMPDTMPDDWAKHHMVSLFRALIVSWSALRYSDQSFKKAANLAAESVSQAQRRNYHTETSIGVLASMIVCRSIGDNDSETIEIIADVDLLFANQPDFESISEDCNFLERGSNHFLTEASLTREKLWLSVTPASWRIGWASTLTRLVGIEPSYIVWIKWFDRRVVGEEAAFDIPGDTDRKEDKAILARLADATEENFWGKGALYVNTTLQGWIDDARLRAELETIIRKLSDGALRQAGSVQEAECRAELVGKLAAALGTAAPEHGGMGHNFPPESIDPYEVAELPPEFRDEASAMVDELSKPEPDALAVAVTLSRWAKMKSTFQHDEFSKNFSGELGTSVAKGLVIVFLSLCSLGLLWLKALLGI